MNYSIILLLFVLTGFRLNAAEFSYQYQGLALQEKGYHIWGSSPVKGQDGRIHLYVARWPIHTQPNFQGWFKDCEIAHYVGDKPQGPFKFVRVAVKDLNGKFNSPHNPTVKLIDGKYVLCFIVNENNSLTKQRIVMYVADDLDDNWKPASGAEKDGTILRKSAQVDDWNHEALLGVSNPTLIKHKGKYLLYNKSVLKKGRDRAWIYGVAVADKLQGPYKHYSKEVTTFQLEDAYAFPMNGSVYMISRDFRASKGSSSGGLLWKSEDGRLFARKDVKRAYEGLSHYIGKEALKKANIFRGTRHGHLERPQILFENGKPAYLYLATGINTTKDFGSCSHVFRINIKETEAAAKTELAPQKK